MVIHRLDFSHYLPEKPSQMQQGLEKQKKKADIGLEHHVLPL
jgi:hypothetical protein